VKPKSIGIWTDEILVGVRSAVAVELPELADLGDHVHVKVADDQFLVGRVAHVPHELAAGIHEVGLAVEIVVPQWLDADPVDGADVVAVGQGVRDLLHPP